MINGKKSEILSILCSMLRVNLGEEIFSFKEFQEFLTSERISFLRISYLPTSNKIILTNNASSKTVLEKEVSVTLYKTKAEVNLETFFEDVDLTFTTRPVNLILNELDSNIINKIPKGMSNAVSLFENFKERLTHFDKKMKNKQINEGVVTEENFDAIFSVEEELDFWRSLSLTNSNSQERAKLIYKNFSKLEKYFNPNYEISSENVNEVVTSLVGCCEDTLQDVAIIPKINPERVKHFLNLALDSLAAKVNSSINKLNLSEGSSLKIHEFSKGFKFVFDRIEVLNKLFFAKSPIIIDEFNKMSKTYTKVNDLIETKTLVNELTKLLPNLSIDVNINLLDEVKSNLNRELENASSLITQKLDEDVFSSGNHILTMLREMQNWKGFLNKKSIQELTIGKRQILLKELVDYLVQLKAAFDSKGQETIEAIEESSNLSSAFSGTNISPKMAVVIWAHTLKGKVETGKKLSSPLKDLSDYSQFINKADSLIQAITSFINESITDWQTSLMENSSNLLPKVGADLIEINNKTGFLNVNFSSALFVLIGDVRVLGEFGYTPKLSKEIIKINEEGKKILKEAISLKQIANFYNTLSSQVIPSQKPMLVQNAKEFESNLMLLSERSKLKKANKNEGGSLSQLDLENFVNLVQSAANDLTKEIRNLRKAHSTILDLITSLLNYDLISHRSKWKDILKKSRNVFNETVEKYSPEVTNEWKNHWNYQLYKVLKIQFSLSLEKFHMFVSSVDCEMLVTNKTVHTSPSLEDLKKNAYKEIKSFVSIPTLIKGFSEDCDYYGNLVTLNAPQINNLYTSLNSALMKLDELKEKLSEVVSLTYVDYESYITNNFTKMRHWKFNYDLIKKKEKEIEKLDEIVKVEIFKVNLRSFKIYSEETFERIYEIFASTLKDNLKLKISSIDAFVKEGMEKMSQKPQTMQEILDFKLTYMNLTRKKFDYKKICDECEEMNKLLFIMSSSQSMNLSNFSSRWMNFDTMMGSFSEMIEEQKEKIKQDLNNKMNNFNSKLEKFYSKWQSCIIDRPEGENDISSIGDSIKKIYDEWNTHETEIQKVIDECQNFEIELPEMTLFNSIKKEVTQNKSKWENFFLFENDLNKIHEEEWLSIRHKAYNTLQDLIMNWQDKVKKIEKDFIYFHIVGKLDTFKNSLAIYKYLIGDNFERDHWKYLFNLLKMDNKITKENLKFGNFINCADLLIKKANEIKDLYSRAQGEILIRNAISELAAWFETAEYSFTNWLNPETGRKTPLIKDWKELMNEISEKSALLISIKSSQFFSRFQEQIEQFEIKFSNLDTWLTNLNLIQRKWIYLEPIFTRGALPKESARFKKIDDEFRGIMNALSAGTKVTTIFSLSRVKESLEMLIDQLEKCQKALNDFLEEKRNKFPRLYFLGDDDLLEFLAKSKDPSVIKNNLKKLYQGITNIDGENIKLNKEKEMNPSKQKINSILSFLSESVNLVKPVLITDDLHQWLNELTDSMKVTLSTNLIEGLSKFKNSNLAHLDAYSAQICALIEMLNFNYQATVSIQSGNVKELKDSVVKLINSLSIISAKSGGDTIKLFKIKNLMLDLIHNREVADTLLTNNVTSSLDWFWFSQLKYSMQSNLLKVEMCDAQFDYTFEYQGACAKLVHTPLTDKCYLTLTQALRLGYGGNPYGPAGTGKTESVKALGQAMGRQVLVFNCDEGIDFKAMARIFIGLVKSGAWGCFDEFNRLLEEQLSAISIQIQVIQFALKNLEPSCSLLNMNVTVDFHSAIFVTLNPAGKGYGGRSKLPDNLKVLFRPVAMSVPDNRQIAQTLLTAEGFKHSEILSKKVVTLFSSCKSGLSNQIHYDWGLRALKTILTVANSQISILINKGESPNEDEEMQILIKAIRINVLSKLTFEDAKEFTSILNDVFPGVKSSDITYADLNDALISVYREINYDYIPTQAEKVIQFHEACKGRMGLVLVGPSGCGKSTIWSLLAKAYKKLGQEVVLHVINPKSMPRWLLLGQMNHDTGDYTYGVLTKCAREVEKEPIETKCWIVLDGDVDPEWIEALNSVLDDNRLLTMQNGERINFGQNVNFIFETDSLKFASPATVSRMGIIYMNKEDLDTKSIVTSWIRKYHQNSNQVEPDQVDSFVKDLFDNYFYEAYDILNKEYNLMLSTTAYGTINSFFSLLSDLKGKSNLTKVKFTDALIKGLGANLSTEDKKRFAMYVYSLTGEKPQNLSMANALDYTYNSQRDELTPYQNTSTEENYSSAVQTHEVLRYKEMIQVWLDKNEPFIIIGPEGCGKALAIESAVQSSKSCAVSIFHCTDRTSASNVIQKLLQSCVFSNTGKGRCLRPKVANKLVLYLKDINLPKPDKYATIGLISFLQQLVTYGGYYDENLDFVHLERIQIIASMNPPSTLGRHEITTRFTGNVRILYIDYPSAESLVTIYSKLFKPEDYSHLLADASVSLYQNIKTNFLPDENRHYIFTPRHLTEISSGLQRYLNEEYDSTDSDNKKDIKSCILPYWGYEVCRVFRDKLVTQEHLSKFDRFLSNEITKLTNSKHFGTVNLPVSNILSQIFTSIGGSLTLNSTSTNSALSLSKINREDYIELLNKGKLLYERDNEDLFLFTSMEEVLNSMKSIDRAISQSESNLVLVGSKSIGRKKAVKIIASALHYEIISTSLTKDFNVKDFRKALKEVYSSSALEGRTTVWLIEEHHMAAGFSDYINSLLCSGEVPGLFTNEEIDAFMDPLMSTYKEQNDYKTLYDFFVSRVKKYLRIVVILDWEGREFNNLLLNNPALISKCKIIWYQEFSKDSLINFSRESLEETSAMIKSSIKNFDLEKVIKSIIEVYHISKEEGLATSHDKFIEFINQFKSMISKKMKNSTLHSSHLQSGLDKLIEAEKFVEDLTEKSKTQKKEIEAKSNEANLSLEKIQDAMVLSSEKRAHLEKLTKTIEEETIIVEQNKSKVEEELKDVLPEVEKAKNLVKSLDSAALSEIRAYFKMPVLKTEIYLVLKAMLQLIGYSDLSSEGVKSTFNMETISSLKNFDVKKLTAENCKKVMTIVNSNPNYFEKSYISRVNYSLAQIAEYVNAIIRFYFAKENIKPLEAQLEDAENKLNKSKARLEQNRNDLLKIDAQMAECKETFARKTGEAELLRIEFNKNEDSINKARSLLGKLTGEKQRWLVGIEELKFENETMPYNSLYASAFVTFLGYYNESLREKVSKLWKHKINEVIGSEVIKSAMTINKFLLSESETLVLKSQGLPNDDLSLQNAIIINNSFRTTFIIDPVSKATNWFKTFNNSNSQVNSSSKTNNSAVKVFESISMSDNKLLTSIELAIRFGKILLVTDLDSVEPFLVSLIRKETTKRGPSLVVKLGEKLIDLHENFRIYFSTRDSSVQIPTGVLTSLSIVNFTVTKSGLEALLLGLTIDIEQPSLEKKKNESMQEQDRIKLELSEVERKLLDQLINLEGNLLENKALISSLEESKEKSLKSEMSLKMSVELGIELDLQRDIYKPLSKLATVIYLLLFKLEKINPMYQFSLENFIGLFKKTIKHTEKKSSMANEQINLFMTNLIKSAYLHYSRSLFKSDILVFGLYYIKSISEADLENEKSSNLNENSLLWAYLMGTLAGEDSTNNVQIPNWLQEERKEHFIQFSRNFPNVISNLNLKDKKWEEWYNSTNPEESIANLNRKSSNKSILDISTSLLNLAIIKVFRPDRLESAMKIFICSSLGINSVNPLSLPLSKILSEIEDNRTPLLFVTTLGSDPSKEVEDFARENVSKEDYIEIPLGAGDNDKVMATVREACKSGQWICLKNLHLATTWLTTLEKVLKNLEEIHPRFRMFLTSEPHSKFSPVLLQSCVKVTYETPPGIKKNLERIYQIWSNTILKSEESSQSIGSNNSSLSPIINQSLFALALVHAILQERRTYIPQGWSKFYEFSYVDLKVSAETLVNYLTKSDSEISWRNIRGLIIDSFYGGRIDNDFDFKVMQTYINKLLDKQIVSNPKEYLMNKIPVHFSSDLGKYYKTISEFSESDQPEMFALPSNVDRSVQRFVSEGVFKKLNSIYSIDTNNNKFEKVIWTEKLSPLLKIWRTLLNLDAFELIKRSVNKLDTKDPINNFVKSEVGQLVNLVKSIENKMNNISSVLTSNGLMTNEVMKDCLSLLQSQVPGDWMSLYEGPDDAASFLKSVARKITGMANYVKAALNDSLINQNINLAELVRPEAFLNALRQKTARLIKTPIDNLVLGCDFGGVNSPSVFVKLSGLFLQGCGFNQGRIVYNPLDQRELISLPVMNLFWTTMDKIRSSSGLIDLPLYENVYRDRLICKLALPFEGDYDEMILKGIAICLE